MAKGKKRANKTRKSRKKSGGTKVYYFKGRTTGVFAKSAKEAKRKKKRPKSDKIVSQRKPVRGEGENGNWSTRRPDGKTKAKTKHKGKGLGPKPKRRSNKK